MYKEYCHELLGVLKSTLDIAVHKNEVTEEESVLFMKNIEYRLDDEAVKILKEIK